MTVHERLTGIFRSVFSDENIELTDAMTAGDVNGWDSIGHISLIFAIEEEFRIKFSTGELGRLTNVGEFYRLICKRLNVTETMCDGVIRPI